MRGIDRQTDRQTDRQRDSYERMDRQTERKTDRETERQTDRLTKERQTDRQGDRKTEGRTERQMDQRTDKKTDRQLDRETDRQTDRQMLGADWQRRCACVCARALCTRVCVRVKGCDWLAVGYLPVAVRHGEGDGHGGPLAARGRRLLAVPQDDDLGGGHTDVSLRLVNEITNHSSL